MRTIMWLHRFKRNKRGISTVIAMVLGLVILVIVVANVVLWSYKMNQYDWERMNEKLNLTATTRSVWSIAQNEYRINSGSLTSGTYIDTQMNDAIVETFRERTSVPRMLDINGTFIINLTTYPLANIKGIEILIEFQASDANEVWYLKAYNWTSGTYSNNGFNTTLGFTPTTTTNWDTYKISITSQLTTYVRSDGKMLIKFHDAGADSSATTVRIDFLAVRAIMDTLLSFKNDGPLTSHVISLWIINSTIHSHYNVDYFINSGSRTSFFSSTIILPGGQCSVKAVTDRGNIIVCLAGYAS